MCRAGPHAFPMIDDGARALSCGLLAAAASRARDTASVDRRPHHARACRDVVVVTANDSSLSPLYRSPYVHVHLYNLMPFPKLRTRPRPPTPARIDGSDHRRHPCMIAGRLDDGR
jgi:hypothetical protein